MINKLNFIKTSVLIVAVIAFGTSVLAQNKSNGKRVGIIGLDTSHSIAFTKALNDLAAGDTFGGYKVVAAYPFRVGDLAVYCEIDCLMPDKPEFEFLKPRGMRVRTIRLRGQISQGICFPLSILPSYFEISEDADCTEVIGIEKYEPPVPACLSGIAKGNFPSFIPKTDETRVQVLQHVLDKYKGTTCYVTEKVDGNSGTYFINAGEFGVCSRNLELMEDEESSFWKVARQM